MTADRRLPGPVPPAFFGPLGAVPFGGGEGVGNPSRAVSAWGGRRCRIWSLLLASLCREQIGGQGRDAPSALSLPVHWGTVGFGSSVFVLLKWASIKIG